MLNRIPFIAAIFGIVSLLIACHSPEPKKSPEMEHLVVEVNAIRNPAMNQQARKLMDSGFASIENKGNLDAYYYYDFYNWFFKNKQERDTALMYADSMQHALEGLSGIEELQAHALVTKGIALKALKRYPEALQAFYAANVFAESYSDSCASSEVFISLGFMLYEQKNYQDAVHYLDRAYRGTKTCPPMNFHRFFARQEMCLNALGLCFEKMEQYDSAEFYYTEAINFIDYCIEHVLQDSGYANQAKGVVFGNLGNTKMFLGKLKEAETCFNEAIHINYKPKREYHDAVLTQIKLLNLFVTQGRNHEFDSLLIEVQHYCDSTHNAEANKRLSQVKRNYFLGKGMYQEAYLAAVEYQHLNDSLNQLTKELTHMDVERALTEFSRHDELLDLKSKDERRTLYVYGSLVLALTLGIIAFLIRKNLRITRSNMKDLDHLNKEVIEQNHNLSIAMENLENSHDEMQRVLGVVAHDLRNPIGSIVSLAEVISYDESLSDNLKEPVQLIQTLGKDSIGLMEGLLNSQLINEELNPEPVDLFALIKYCLGVMELSAKAKGIHLVFSGNPQTIQGSRDMLWRVLINLLSNAIKFSESGKQVRIRLYKESEKVIVAIQDEGIGIPAHLQEEVFTMLTKAKREGTKGEKAHGLGLSISKRIMELHGGRIWLESQEGKGTTFYLEFV